MSTDECFAILASLATLDETSHDELGPIADHLRLCSQCRLTFAEFASALEGEKARKVRTWLCDLLSEIVQDDRYYKQQFLSRARARGISFSDNVAKIDSRRLLGRPLWRLSFVAASIGLLVLAVLLGSHIHRPQISANKQDALTTPKTEAELSNQLAFANVARVEAENNLTHAHSQIAAEREYKRKLEGELALLQRKLSELQDAQAAAAQRRSELESRAHSAETLSSQASLELERSRESEDRVVARLGQQQYRISELSTQLEIANAKLAADTELLAANKDIRDVMGARNLHLIDVQDVEGRGKTRKTFGRIFYAEGKTLTFYVFNPDDRVRDGRDTLQAWGYREPASTRAQSLGIFYQDDDKLKRWVLRFDNPEILERIDTVFVTLEPSGGAKDPSHKKLLYAFLNQQPNHP